MTGPELVAVRGRGGIVRWVRRYPVEATRAELLERDRAIRADELPPTRAELWRLEVAHLRHRRHRRPYASDAR